MLICVICGLVLILSMEPCVFAATVNATLELTSPDASAQVILRCNEVVRQPYPSLCFHVALRQGDLSGANPQVWLDEPSLQEFIRQLGELHSGRPGEAVLSAMSPGEFELRVQAPEPLRSLLVTATVSRLSYLGHAPTYVTHSATIHFELDPAQLGQALAEFRALRTLLIFTEAGD